MVRVQRFLASGVVGTAKPVPAVRGRQIDEEQQIGDELVAPVQQLYVTRPRVRVHVKSQRVAHQLVVPDLRFLVRVEVGQPVTADHPLPMTSVRRNGFDQPKRQHCHDQHRQCALAGRQCVAFPERGHDGHRTGWHVARLPGLVILRLAQHRPDPGRVLHRPGRLPIITLAPFVPHAVAPGAAHYAELPGSHRHYIVLAVQTHYGNNTVISLYRMYIHNVRVNGSHSIFRTTRLSRT